MSSNSRRAAAQRARRCAEKAKPGSVFSAALCVFRASAVDELPFSVRVSP